MKSVLRYAGGKTRAVKFLSKLIPEGTTELCAPFIGGGSFELECACKGIKIHGYDNFEALVDFWNYLIHAPQRLADEIRAYKTIDRDALKIWRKTIFSETEPLNRAVMFFVLNRTTFGGSTLNGGFYTDLYQRFNENIINRVEQFKISQFAVCLADFKDSIPKHSDKLLYLDPPYVGNDRLYAFSKISKEPFDHQALFELLKNRGKWILCYNDVPQIRELYQGFKIIQASWKYGISNISKDSSEIIIVSDDLEV